METKARAVAFYLPQFFPIPENDLWWGPGFTEWTSVARARPLFPGHRQPTLPSDLGFYDLRVPETRHAQSELAMAHGIEAFAYWHYWFGGGDTILDRPFREVLDSGVPGVKFCLAWANQTWSGIWHGAPDRVLKEQTYPGGPDEEAHFRLVLRAFQDPRYLRVDDRPVFYVFRPEELPDPAKWVRMWRAMARDAGLRGLYLVAEVSDLLGAGPRYGAGKQDGFDAGVYVRLPARVTRAHTLRMRVLRKSMRGPEIWPYDDAIVRCVPADRWHQPCIYPNWDNTPRSGRGGLVVTGASPDRFRKIVRDGVRYLEGRPPEERLLWVKSWNEWAEGNHLEPDLRHGRAWLDALREELVVDGK